jgi:uncharacterized membrane protein
MNTFKTISRVLMSLFYLGGGINHFISPQTYVPLMPPYLPNPELLQAIAGGVEIVVAIGFWIPRFRYAVALVTIAMLTAFMTVHVYHLQLGQVPGIPTVPMWVLWARVPMQFAFAAWAWWHRK